MYISTHIHTCIYTHKNIRINVLKVICLFFKNFYKVTHIRNFLGIISRDSKKQSIHP